MRSACANTAAWRIGQRRAGLFVFGIGITRAHTRAALDQHLMAAPDELIRAGGQERHAIFLLFDFLGDADDHGLICVVGGGMNSFYRARSI